MVSIWVHKAPIEVGGYVNGLGRLGVDLLMAGSRIREGTTKLSADAPRPIPVANFGRGHRTCNDAAEEVD